MFTKNPCTRMFIAALFMIANKWKQFMSVKRRIDKQTCIFIQWNTKQQRETVDTLNNMDESHKLYAE